MGITFYKNVETEQGETQTNKNNFIIVFEYDGYNLIHFNIQPFTFYTNGFTLKTDLNSGVYAQSFINNIGLKDDENKTAQCLLMYQKSNGDTKNLNPSFINQTINISIDSENTNQLVFKLDLNVTEITGLIDEFDTSSCKIIKILETII